MPRTARVAPPEQVYHILTRGNNRQEIFKSDQDYQEYKKIVQRYKAKYDFWLYHYVLMTNHVHLVLETTQRGGSLSDIMKGINLSYAQYYKSRYNHIGHFWQDRYKSILISKDEYSLACGSYAELNPVRAHLVKDPKDYRWSSYNGYAFGRGDPIIDEHPIYQGLSRNGKGRRKAYREFVKGMLISKNAMKGEMERRVVYGGADFLKKTKQLFGIEETIRTQGRPRKQEKGGK